VAGGAAIAAISGRARSLLIAERTALNFLQRMSGIATLTRRYVEAVAGAGARILDTRKTAPGLRCLDKWAVALGGGANHRFGLFDGILIKDNHLRCAGGICPAVAAARAAAPHGLKVQVEVETIAQVREALDCGADALLLDNMSLDDMRAAVGLARGRALTEASGGVTLETVRGIAQAGVDFISVGALTHSAPALDIALEVGD
jgi:nicotinate-nucleotide pyrophosphorylase (carboxylating)